jgi:hypothetical protein
MTPVPADDLPDHLAATPSTAAVPTSDLPDHLVPPSSPSTTAAGVAGGVTRGLAPYAAGAAAGAALGAPFAGVGAIPGAAAGAGAVGLTQLATALYKPLAERFGWPTVATPQEMTDRVLDVAGVKRPQTGIEREAQAVSGGAAGAFTGAGAAGQLAERMAPGVGKEVSTRLAEKPALQAASGAVGGAAAQTAAESGAGPIGQAVAGFLGSLLPYGSSVGRGLAAVPTKPAADDAIRAGYTIPPIEAAEGRLPAGSIGSAGSAISGKIKTGQYAATANQPVTNRLAATDLGLPPDTLLTDKAFEDVRQEAGKDYAAIKAIPVVKNTQEYVNEANKIGEQARQAAAAYATKDHPNVIPTAEIDAVRAALVAKPERATADAIEFVRQMRFQSQANLRSRDDPSKLALGLAQRQAANITEDMMEANLAATGDQGLLQRYRAARQRIAKSYDVESVTNVSTGDVSARGLGRLLDKGKPLTGNLRLIADSANTFPRAFQNPAGFGGVEPFSVLDSLSAAAAVSSGHLGLAASVLGRPLARSTILSGPFQRAMISDRPSAIPLPLLTDIGALSTVSPAQSAAQSLGAGITP